MDKPLSIKKKSLYKYTIGSLALLLVVFLLQRADESGIGAQTVPAFQAEEGGRLASVERKKARDDYFRMVYGDPATGRIPSGIKSRELEWAKRLPRKEDLAGKQAALDITWAEAGPNDVSGRTRAIAIDVTNSNTVLAGGTTGGIWRSTDAGANWTLVSEPHLAVTRVAQDPRAGQTSTWYAATGESAGSYNNGSETGETLHGTGMYKSTDGGVTWTRIQVADTPTSATGQFDYIPELIVSPATGSVFAVLNQNGVFRSTDGGATFTSVLGETGRHPHADVVVDANGALLAVLYNTVTFEASGVYRSTDDGTTWSEVFADGGSSFPDPYDFYFERTVIGLSASNPDVAYLLTYLGQKKAVTGGEVDDMRLFKLTISSGTYEDRTDGIPVYLDGTGAVNVGGYDSQGNYNMTIAVHPTDENHVFIGGTNLFRSRDGFATAPAAADGWVGGYATANDISQYANSHPDHHALVFDPNNPNRLYNGHDGGISVVSDVTTAGPINWTWLNNKYNVTQFYQASISRVAGDNRIAGGTQDNGSPFFSFDGTTTSSSTDQSSGDGAYQYLGATDLYSSSQQGNVNYYVDNAGTPQYAGEAKPCSNCGALFIHPYTVDPVNENIVFYPAGQDLYRGVAPDQITTFEHTWTRLDALQLPAGYGFSALTVSQGSSTGVLYYAGYSASAAPVLYQFANSSTATNGAVERSIPGAAAGGYILSIAVNPDNSDEILVVIANYNTESLYHSVDGGQSYTGVEGNLAGSGNDGPSIRSATILPFGGETIYVVGTSTGVYSTQTFSGASTSWAQEGGTQMGNVAIGWVDSRKSDGRIIAATHGRGIFVGTPSASVGNSAPVAADVTGSGNEDSAVSVTLSASDANSDALTYSVVAQPSNGTVAVSGATVTYTPTADFFGSDSFTYTANDGMVDSNTATASVTVAAVNDAPSFTAGADQSVDQDLGAQTVAGWATAMSTGPANESSQAISFEVTAANTALFSAGPAVAPDGTLSFTTAAGATGTSNVTVVAVDDGGTANGGVDRSAAQTFMITANAVSQNAAPVAADVVGSGLEDATADVQLSATDSNGDSLTYALVSQPSKGSATLSGTTVTYTPAADFFGSDSFTYKANDGTVDSNTATATVTVGAVNDPPSFTAGADVSASLNAGAQVFAGWASDISAGPANESAQVVAFDVVATDGSLFSVAPAISAAGELSFTPAGTPGETTIEVVAYDDGGIANGGNDESEVVSFTITIADPTGVSDEELPTEFRLDGAYPNPFNPATTIQFDLPAAADVSLEVVSMAGKTVMRISGVAMSAGARQQMQINAAALPSGTYLYRVVATMAGVTESATGSLILLK